MQIYSKSDSSLLLSESGTIYVLKRLVLMRSSLKCRYGIGLMH